MQHDLKAGAAQGSTRLLAPGDPEPVLQRAGTRPVLLTVEHADRAIPQRLGTLGLSPGDVDRHIGWDIGALDLALSIADRLDVTLVAQRYSRLVIDCNRPWESDELVPEISDRQQVPGNAAMRPDDRRARWDEVHQPYHNAVADAAARGPKALVAIHSYDPQRDVDATPRPWPIALLYREANPFADGLRAALAADERVLPLGVNAPYQIEDESDYTIPVHAERRGLPHVLIEVRNDHLRNSEGITRVADILTDAFHGLDVL